MDLVAILGFGSGCVVAALSPALALIDVEANAHCSKIHENAQAELSTYAVDTEIWENTDWRRKF